MSRAAGRAPHGALVAVAVLGVAVSLAGCGTARSVSRSPAVTVQSMAGTAADTPSGAATPVTPTSVPIRQDDLDELGAALSDGSALTTELESDMAKDSTE